MRWIVAKSLEVCGAALLLLALLNGLGLNRFGEPSLAREIFLLLVGAALLACGVLLEPLRAAQGTATEAER